MRVLVSPGYDEGPVVHDGHGDDEEPVVVVVSSWIKDCDLFGSGQRRSWMLPIIITKKHRCDGSNSRLLLGLLLLLLLLFGLLLLLLLLLFFLLFFLLPLLLLLFVLPGGRRSSTNAFVSC